MKDIALSKLKEWFGDLYFVYNILECGEEDCVILTISNGCEENKRNIDLYKIFRIGDKVELSGCINYSCDITSDSSLVMGIADIMRKYARG